MRVLGRIIVARRHVILLPVLYRGLKQLGILITYCLEVCWQADSLGVFLWHLRPYGTGRSCRPALATAVGDERTVPVEPGLGVGRSWGSALDSGEGAGVCSLTGRLLELGCSHGTQWQSCSSSVISISCWSGLGRKKGLEAKPVIKRRSGWFSLQGRSVVYGKWRYCCL